MAPRAEVASLAFEPATILQQTSFQEPQKLQEPQSEASWAEDAASDNDNTRDFLQRTKADDVTVQETTTAESMNAQEPAKKCVQFSVVDVVEFEPSMWTPTVPSEGVPLGMSIDVRRRTKRPLDTYEIERLTQRVDRQEYMELGYLEPEERLDILENAGHSISIISHVERDTLRINRERWESNEYDLMYQYGLGEVPLIEDSGLEMVQSLDGDDIMHVDDSSEDNFFFGCNSRNMVVDSELRFAMEDMDAYDAINTRAYDDLTVDYASECILGDDESSDENNELPYAIDSFDTPHSCDFLEMGALPSDVSSSSDCKLTTATATSCAWSAGSTTSCASYPSESSSVISVEVVPVVAV